MTATVAQAQPANNPIIRLTFDAKKMKISKDGVESLTNARNVRLTALDKKAFRYAEPQMPYQMKKWLNGSKDVFVTGYDSDGRLHSIRLGKFKGKPIPLHNVHVQAYNKVCCWIPGGCFCHGGCPGHRCTT